MGSDYHARRHAGHRKMLALLIEEMRPQVIVQEGYEILLRGFHRGDEEQDRGLRKGTVRTFATCLACLGEGAEENPLWVDGETPHEPETIDCDSCRGTGLVEIIDMPEPPSAAPVDDEMPF